MRIEKIIAKALEYANDDHYVLSLMVAKRSNELAEGAMPMIKADTKKMKLTDIALQEISEGLVQLDKIIED